MKYIKTLLLAILFASTAYCQKSKTLCIGVVSDFPISEKLFYNYGIGAEASLIINTANVKNVVLAFSALQYQFYYYSFPILGAEQERFVRNKPFYRLTIGKHIKVSGKLFFNAQAGFAIGEVARGQSSQIQPTFLIGPTIIFPIKEKYCLKLHGSFGTFAGGFFANMGAAFGFKF
jgi:hypothetical protein